jgi:hypothetical protein
MAIDLSSYPSIQTNLFVRLEIPGYQILTFSDYHTSITFSGTTYQGLGQLLEITNTTNSLRATSEELSMTISGIPTGNISSVLNYKIKGSKLDVYRAFFNPTTGILLNIQGNPAGKFKGIINNYNISDELNDRSTGKLSIVFSATGIVEQLNNKVTGRRTNPIDEKLYFPNDRSMDRVPGLANSNFNFGAPV